MYIYPRKRERENGGWCIRVYGVLILCAYARAQRHKEIDTKWRASGRPACKKLSCAAVCQIKFAPPLMKNSEKAAE